MSYLKMNTSRNIKSRFCLMCNKEIPPIYPESHNKKGPQCGMWKGGIVDKIIAGYGSNLDESMYIIAICDTCIEANLDKIEYIGDYM